MSMARWFLVAGMGRREINRICPTITPVLGAELFTDPGLESWIDANNLTSWIEGSAGGSSVNREDVDVHGGSHACRLDIDAGNANASIYQQIANVIGDWIHLSAWFKASLAGKSIILAHGADGPAQTGTDYAQIHTIQRATANNHFLIAKRGSAASSSLYLDDMSAKSVTFSSARYPLGKLGRQTGTWTATPTVALGTVAGILLNYTDDDNFVMAIVNRGVAATQAQIVKRVTGTYTNVVVGNVAYGAGNELRVVVDGTDYSLYYNAIQVGAATPIADAMGRQVYGFNTYAGNEVGTVTTSKN